jgi:hypothetical protein
MSMNPPSVPLFASSPKKNKFEICNDPSINAAQHLYLSRKLDYHSRELLAATGLRHTNPALATPGSCTQVSSKQKFSSIASEQKHITNLRENMNFSAEKNGIACRRKLSDTMILEQQLAIQALSNSIGYLPFTYDARLLANVLLTSHVSNNSHLVGNVRSPILQAMAVTRYCDSAVSNLISPVGSWQSPSRPVAAFENHYYERASHDVSSHGQLRSVGCKVDTTVKKNTQNQIVYKKTSSFTSMGDTTSGTSTDTTGGQVLGNAPVELYRPIDSHMLSEYQCFVRQQIEFFEADETDVASNAKGRNKPVVLGQVGIRCRHCAAIPPRYRRRGAMYYPTKMHLIYQAAQNMVKIHLHQHCKNVPEAIQCKLSKLHKSKCSVGGGKAYWDEGAAACNVYEASDGCLRFCQLSDSRTNKMGNAADARILPQFTA